MSLAVCYASTNKAEEEDKDNFSVQLQSVVDNISKQDMLVLMGNMTVKVWRENIEREWKIGQYGIWDKNENRELLVDFCAVNSLRN